jgi:hypothetical protein
MRKKKAKVLKNFEWIEYIPLVDTDIHLFQAVAFDILSGIVASSKNRNPAG